MRIQFVSSNQTGNAAPIIVTGYLQDEEVVFGINNSYSAPFEGGQTKADIMADLVAQFASGGRFSTRFSYMYNSFWNGAVPPKVTFKVAFISVDENSDILGDAMSLLDMFAMERNIVSQLVPPGGLTAGGLLASLKDIYDKGIEGASDKIARGVRGRTVDVYIGTNDGVNMKFIGLLPENVEFKGKLPLIKDGNFQIIYCTCTLQNPNLMIKGQPFIQRSSAFGG